MRAVLLKDFNNPLLTIENVETPQPKPGQVLIKMAAAPINPSDLIFLRNQYGVTKKLPVVPGFEGSGTVISANGGLYAKWLVGKRVACHAPEDGNGTWAEFMVCQPSQVVPLIHEVTLEQGASFLVNPLTAWALLSIAKEGGHKAFIQTAAAGALGRMMDRLARRWGLIGIHIVRRREQVELMKKEGAIHVLDTSQPGWQEQLKVLSQRFSIGIAFDAVGGELSAQLAQAMAKRGRVIVYGALAGENCQVSPLDLLFEGKRLEGFWLPLWIKSRSRLQNLQMAYQSQKFVLSDLKTDVQAKFPLEKVQEAIAQYKERRTDGKVLVIP